MIAKLDNMVEGGSGDEQYKNLFCNIMINFCEKHTVMRDQVNYTRILEQDKWIQVESVIFNLFFRVLNSWQLLLV